MLHEGPLWTLFLFVKEGVVIAGVVRSKRRGTTLASTTIVLASEEECRNNTNYICGHVVVGGGCDIVPHQTDMDHFALLLGGLRLCRGIASVRHFKALLDAGLPKEARTELLMALELFEPFLELIDGPIGRDVLEGRE
jgi:hypothetical protein